MLEQTLMPLEASVQTGDSSNIVLWIIIGALAVVLIVACAVLSVVGKKKREDGDDTDRKNDRK